MITSNLMVSSRLSVDLWVWNMPSIFKFATPVKVTEETLLSTLWLAKSKAKTSMYQEGIVTLKLCEKPSQKDLLGSMFHPFQEKRQ
jgi:hypothetical protein